MAEKEQELYIGIDLNDNYAMVSFATTTHKEPETVSSVAGSEMFQIPLAVCMASASGQWVYGDEAVRFGKADMGRCEKNLLSRSLERDFTIAKDQTYEIRELLAIFLKKILSLAGKLGPKVEIGKVVFTFEKLNTRLMELMEYVFAQLPVRRDRITAIDYMESFYYYALSQKEGLATHDIVMFQYYGENVTSWYLTRKMQPEGQPGPRLVHILETDCGYLMDDKDADFANIIPKIFQKKLISSVYLAGEGFEGGWLKHSLQVLCQGKRVFLGKNLFSKGACYAAQALSGLTAWNYIYMGANKLKLDVRLHVRKKNEMAVHTLLAAGSNWYEEKSAIEVILDGPGEVEFRVNMFGQRDIRPQLLELKGLPVRPRKATRLRIEAKPVSDRAVKVIIQDLGLGEFFKASNLTWEHIITINS